MLPLLLHRGMIKGCLMMILGVVPMRKRYQSFLVHVMTRVFIYVALNGNTAEEAERFELGERIREVEQGPDGALYVLEDGAGGRLLKLTPSR
jgi:glucose/arabinose dehydrogenase